MPYSVDDWGNVEWVDSSNLTCQLCQSRIRMVGREVCTYCHFVALTPYVNRGIEALEKHLETYVLWSVYQAEHRTEGEANA